MEIYATGESAEVSSGSGVSLMGLPVYFMILLAVEDICSKGAISALGLRWLGH